MAEQKAGNWFSNFVSDVGRGLNAPVIFDWDTEAARADAQSGATWGGANGKVKRTANDIAYQNQATIDKQNDPNVQRLMASQVQADIPGQIALPPGTGNLTGGGTFDPAAAARAAEMAKVQKLRGDIKGKQSAVQQAYELLFGDIDRLARDRSAEVEKNAGENISKLTGQYTEAIPGIESSYAAVGAGDSTDTRDAKVNAKAGFDDSVKQVGKTKSDDLAKIGQYTQENKGKWNAERDSVLRLISRVDETEDVGDLNEARNTVEGKLGSLGAERDTLGTDSGARGKLKEITGDNGRFAAVKDSLDQIINSSLSGGVKAAAVQAVADSSDLSDEDKEKVKLEYGNVYNAPVA